jgi:DnaJ like chaperone protein
MVSYGKWIGGGLGWVFGGPIGGILGFIFGSMYDGMQSGAFEYKKVTSERPRYGSTQQGDFSISLLILSAAVMRADEKVKKAELDYVKRFFLQQFGQEDAEQKILMLRQILKQDFDLFAVCSQIRQYMEYPSRLQLMHYLFGIIAADGSFPPREIEVTEMIAVYLGVKPNDLSSIKAMFVRDTNSPYRILEIFPDAPDEEVKKAYRRMAVKFHPDKVNHLGEDIQKAAKEKFQQLNSAYQEIKKQRNLN